MQDHSLGCFIFPNFFVLISFICGHLVSGAVEETSDGVGDGDCETDDEFEKEAFVEELALETCFLERERFVRVLERLFILRLLS